ncbi:hypothetical protein LCGC14_2195690 [marine sediment metagenome]|uniref:Phage ABA sandwich domain-containing protein n=1 Tax=marine sediment metagenome TaxID=412755 RepID=A0A0F9DID3_9ZZZZ
MGVTKYRPKITRVPMTDQEKNEVLAKWAGFRYKLSASENNHYWIGPNGQTVDCDESGDALLPDLLHSLDAQAKWLWPKMGHIIFMYSEQNEFKATAGMYNPDAEGTAQADNPAEACAEAILSLIGEQVPA